MHFRLAPRLMTFDDLELLYVQIFGELRKISQIWEPAATAKRMKIDPYCQQQHCNPQKVLFNMLLALICRRFLH